MVQFQRRQKAPGGERRLLRHTYVCAQYVRSRRGETLSFQYLFIEGGIDENRHFVDDKLVAHGQISTFLIF